LEKIHLVNPTFFDSRGPRGSLNPFSRLKNYRKLSGPKQLLMNTLVGFNQLNVEIVTNRNLCRFDQNPIWIPAGDLSFLNSQEIKLLSRENVTLGPNIDWFNDGIARVVNQLNQAKVLVPHHWVIAPVSKRLSKDCRISVWHSGIDTDFWRKAKIYSKNNNVMIYLKNLGDLENLKHAETYLKRRNIKFTTLRYGSYTRTQFKSTLEQVNAAIWIGGTESQGLAMMECWSMGIPTLVLTKRNWIDPDGSSFAASSAPYMTEAEGHFSKSDLFLNSDFDDFFSNLDKYSPRQNVQDTFNLIDCASNLLHILRE